MPWRPPHTAEPNDEIRENFESLEEASNLSWQPLALQNGFAAYSSPTFPAGEYCIDMDGVVHFRGLLKKTPEAWAVNTVIATVPYRPLHQEVFHTWGFDNEATGGGQGYRVDVDPTGNLMVVERAGSATNKGLINFLTISGISFSTQ